MQVVILIKRTYWVDLLNNVWKLQSDITIYDMMLIIILAKHKLGVVLPGYRGLRLLNLVLYLWWKIFDRKIKNIFQNKIFHLWSW